jgi:hypothetical protein
VLEMLELMGIHSIRFVLISTLSLKYSQHMKYVSVDMAPVIGGLTLPVEHCLVRLVPVVYREPNGPLLAHLVEPW